MAPTAGDETDRTGVGRRALLGALGFAAAGRFATAGRAQGSETDADADSFADSYAVVQGDECLPVAPLEGDESVETFYDYRVPEQFGGGSGASDPGRGPYFQSNGTVDLQRAGATVSFLYRGPEGLSLVVVHDSVDGDGGGAVTWTVDGVPEDAEWAVTDDRYSAPGPDEANASNYDEWRLEGDTHTVDWTWGGPGTDGGALRVSDPALRIGIDPAFNEAAALWGDYYAEDPIEVWQFLSFPEGAERPERIPLALDGPVVVGPAPCTEGEREASNGRNATDAD